jgi:glycosyltransferase involved in cell wall biosynthesis
MDGGSNDGTWETLEDLANTHPTIKIFQHKIDFSHKRFAVQDGLQKARARKECQYEFCWQQDSDERISEFATKKIPSLCQQFPRFIDVVALPVIEYWGAHGKIRMDVTPWKWRLSRNKPNITHGIPKELRQTDDAGDTYSLPGTDGCDYVDVVSFERLPHASFYTQDAHSARVAALEGNQEAYKNYSEWFERVVNLMPFVYHYSWTDIARKIRTYKGYWQQHWESLYNVKQEDTADNNMFFDKPWTAVTDEEIVAMASRLETELGGHVFHSKVDWNNPNPYLEITINEHEDSNQ